MEESKKRVIKKYIFFSFLLFVVIITVFLMVRYHVEGEKNLPLQLKEITIRSTIDAQDEEGEFLWNKNIEQNNDIYITFNKNKDIDKKIESIKIENLKINKKQEIGTTKIFLPTSNDLKTCFLKSTEDQTNQTLEFTENSINNLEKRIFNEQDGIIAFRVSNQSIGKYTSNEGDEIKYNKDLLEKAQINSEDIKLNLKFDLIIQINSKEKYKGTIELELPADEFKEEGTISKKITDFSNIIFKRSE